MFLTVLYAASIVAVPAERSDVFGEGNPGPAMKHAGMWGKPSGQRERRSHVQWAKQSVLHEEQCGLFHRVKELRYPKA